MGKNETFVWFLWFWFLVTLSGLWIYFAPNVWQAHLFVGVGFGLGSFEGSFHVSEIADRV